MGTRLVVGLVCLGVLAVPEVAPAAAKKVKGTPVYQSPHFKGPKTLPKNFVPAKPPAPVALSGDGHSAHAFVDAAGTAHVAWAESPAKEGFRALGAAKGARGSLTFTPGPGTGGRRSVNAVIMQSGFNRGQPVVAHYTAPGIVKPGKIRTVSVTHRGTSATVRFGTSRGATAYIVLLKASDGTASQQTIRKGHTATFRDLRAGVTVQALVRGVNIRGAKGPVAKSKKR